MMAQPGVDRLVEVIPVRDFEARDRDSHATLGQLDGERRCDGQAIFRDVDEEQIPRLDWWLLRWYLLKRVERGGLDPCCVDARGQPGDGAIDL
jgi:hypothetical protein